MSLIMTHQMKELVQDHLQAARREEQRWERAMFDCDGDRTESVRARRARDKAARAVRELERVQGVLATFDLALYSFTEVVADLFDKDGAHTAETLARRLFKRAPMASWPHEDWLERHLYQLEKQGVVRSCRNGRGQHAWELLTPKVKARLVEQRREAAARRERYRQEKLRGEAVREALGRLGVEPVATYRADVGLTLEDAEKIARLINGVMDVVPK